MRTILYIVVEEPGECLGKIDLEDLERRICEEDGVQDITLICVNNSADLADKLVNLDMNDPENWDRLKVVMVPCKGEAVGYYPRRLLEEFKRRSVRARSSYEIFKELLFLGKN